MIKKQKTEAITAKHYINKREICLFNKKKIIRIKLKIIQI